MDESGDIVYLETRMDRFKGRWRAMSRTARLGIVSMIFGGIGLLTCFLVSYVPFLSMPFSMIGLLVGSVSFAIGFYRNRRRDGFWFPLIGTVLSLLGLAIGVGNYNHDVESRELKEKEAREGAIAEIEKRLVGRWLKGGEDAEQSLEITGAGSLLWSGSPSTASTGNEETIARYQFRDSSLVVSFGDSGGQERSIVRYNADTSRDGMLLLSDRRVLSGEVKVDMSGSWKRVGLPRALSEAEKEIADYRNKLDRFRVQHEYIGSLIGKFEKERATLLDRLRPYEDGTRQKDDRWKVWARELNSVVNQVDLLNRRLPRVDQAIVRLEAAIGNLTRQAELDRAGLDNRQLEELLLTSERLDEELKKAEVAESVESLFLDQIVQEELDKQDSPDESR